MSVLMTVVIFERKPSSEEPVSIFIPPKMEGFFFKLGYQYLGIRTQSLYGTYSFLKDSKSPSIQEGIIFLKSECK